MSRPWFKTLDFNSMTVITIEEAIGGLGVFECIKVAQEAIEQGEYTLTVEAVKKWAEVKRDRAERILPYAQKYLDKTIEICYESEKIYQKSQKISENLEKSLDFNTSNPSGSNKSIREEIRLEETTTPLPPIAEVAGSSFSESEEITEQKPEVVKLTRNTGKQLTIVSDEETITEKEWFRRQVITRLSSQGNRVDYALTLEQLSFAYPSIVGDLKRRYFCRAPAERKAVIFWLSLKATGDRPLQLAIAAMENYKTEPDKYKSYINPYLTQAEKQILDNDYEVDIRNGEDSPVATAGIQTGTG